MPIQFSNLVFDVSRRELSRGRKRIPVEPNVFDLLAYLIENRDRLVSKETLIAHIRAYALRCCRSNHRDQASRTQARSPQSHTATKMPNGVEVRRK